MLANLNTHPIEDNAVVIVTAYADALKDYLAIREADPEYENVFIARNGTSMDARAVRYRIHKY